MTRKHCEHKFFLPESKREEELYVKMGMHVDKRLCLTSLLSRALFDPPKRDTLLKLGRHCPQFTVFSEFAT